MIRYDSVRVRWQVRTQYYPYILDKTKKFRIMDFDTRNLNSVKIFQPEQVFLEEDSNKKIKFKSVKGEMHPGTAYVQPGVYQEPPRQRKCESCIQCLCCCTLCASCFNQWCECLQMLLCCFDLFNWNARFFFWLESNKKYNYLFNLNHFFLRNLQL